MARRDQTDVAAWVKALGTLCSGTMTVKESQAKMAAYVSMLSREFPAHAFTVDSLAAVARSCPFFPSFGQLSGALSDWLADHGPAANVPLITGPGQDEWRERVERERAEAKADWSDPAKVRASARSLDGHPMRPVLGRMLAALVNRHAPQNVGLLPPEFLTELQRMREDDERLQGTRPSPAPAQARLDRFTTWSWRWPSPAPAQARPAQATPPAELLAAWEKLAAGGVPGAQARVDLLRQQLETKPDV